MHEIHKIARPSESQFVDPPTTSVKGLPAKTYHNFLINFIS